MSDAIKKYRCKHTVEAMQWRDTDQLRDAFADWFVKHDSVFSTRGSVIVLPDGGEVDEGEWILWMDDEWVAMFDDLFRDDYDEVTP